MLGARMAKRKPELMIGLNAVIVAVTNEEPRLLTIRGPHDESAIPFGPIDLKKDRTLESGLRDWVREEAGFELGYAEQVYAFGDKGRNPREEEGGPRVVSVAYLALVLESTIAPVPGVEWQSVYDFLPWEDWRSGPPEAFGELCAAIGRWAEGMPDLADQERHRARIEQAFGLRGAAWSSDRVLERYELLYESGLALEATRDDFGGDERVGEDSLPDWGRAMALDHRRVLATVFGRLRRRIKSRPVVFELLPKQFTLLQLQRAAEALAGFALHKQNFRRTVDRLGLVEGTGVRDSAQIGRPAELFQFRPAALREHVAPGLGLPRETHRFGSDAVLSSAE